MSGILVAYCLLIVCASLAGGILPAFVSLTHTRLQMSISLVGGLMLGVGLLHQLPHATAEYASTGAANALDFCVGWMLVGMVVLFFMLRWFHFHQHEAFETPDSVSESREGSTAGGIELPILQERAGGALTHGHHHGEGHGHAHGHIHGHHPSHGHAHRPETDGCCGVPRGPAPHPLSWVFLTLGLALHTLIDGIALASSLSAGMNHGHSGWFPALGTFLAIFLHKPLDSLPIASLMTVGGWSRKWRHVVNCLYATMCPLGALLFHTGVQRFSGQPQVVVAAALAFSAGAFVCIALSDLLPELEFHSHDRLKLSLMLLLGLGSAWGIGYLEPRHTHQPTPDGAISTERRFDREKNLTQPDRAAEPAN